MLCVDKSQVLLNQTPSALHIGDPASLLYQWRRLDKYKQIDAEHGGMS
jgi:hypothetical protein